MIEPIEKDTIGHINADAFKGLSDYNGAEVKFIGELGASGNTHAADFTKGRSGRVFLKEDQFTIS